MNTNRRLLNQIRSTGLLFPCTVLCGLVSGGLVILQAGRLAKVISGVFLEKLTLDEVKPLLIFLLVIVAFRAAFSVFNEILSGRLAARIKKQLRTLLFEKINRLGPSFTGYESTGELTASALQGVEALDAYFSQYLPQILLAAILPLLILIAVFPADTLTGVVFLITAPLIPFFMMLVGKASEVETRRQWSALSRLSSTLLDTLQGIVTLKNLGQSKKWTGNVKGISEEYQATTLKVLRITFLSALTLELLATLSTAVVAVEIGLRLLYSQMEFEQAFFILLLAPEFYLPMRNLGARFHAGMTGVTAAKRIFDLLDLPEIATNVPGIQPIKISPLSEIPFILRFEKVSFSYPNRERDAVNDIQLTLEKGKTYALLGRSGAGKSTLLQLLLRFIVPTGGNILINGQDLNAIDLHQWRSQLSWVSQSPVLFKTTILENIRLSSPNASLEEVKHAAELARLDDFIDGLPLQYDTQVGENAQLISGGQAQRLALARAFLKDAPLLVMDEPTAHLDARLEKELYESIQTLIQGRTALFIAHRLSTVRNADEIILMDEGRIVGQGKADDLRMTTPLFQELLAAAGGEE